MKQIILGTAGHIDHGKTSLIKALTGTDTDRLKEEKLRGITIELGFASLDLPGGQHVGVVDVPGHEKFVKNMVAGASGIDIVAMVIAADEGVMPQTREHMEICSLLDIKHGIVVLTKIDMVDEEWLELVTDDIKTFLEGTFLEDALILPVSSATGDGIPDFIKSLEHLCKNVPERPHSDLFRLPVDRVFSMKGFGTVITGTLLSGKVNDGDSVMVYPSSVTSKVRGIQAHNEKVDNAIAGMRTAINFQGLDKADVKRGDVISIPGALKPSYMFDLSFHFLSSNNKPLKNRTKVRFHSGTCEIIGTMILIDREDLKPGDTIEAQIRFDSQISGVRDDKYVLRSYSPVRTIGGGRILNPIPGKHKRFDSNVIERLKRLSISDQDEMISLHVDASGIKGVSLTDLKLMTNTSDKQLQNNLSSSLSSKTIFQSDKENKIYIHKNTFEKCNKKMKDYLKQYHDINPLKGGMSKEELKSKFPTDMGSKLFNLMLVQMTKGNEIILEEDSIRLSSHKISLGGDQVDIQEKILAAYKKSGLTPPYFKDICKDSKIDPNKAREVLLLLIEQGKIIKVKEELYFHAEALSALKKSLVDFLTLNGEISTPQFKEMTGASRKFVIPLIEFFDSKNVTIRVGDIRQLRTG